MHEDQAKYRDLTYTITMQHGVPLLVDVVSKGFSMICSLLLENGADPLAETRTGLCPLYVASGMEHKDVVKILLKSGADATKVFTMVCSNSKYTFP